MADAMKILYVRLSGGREVFRWRWLRWFSYWRWTGQEMKRLRNIDFFFVDGPKWWEGSRGKIREEELKSSGRWLSGLNEGKHKC